MNKVFPLVTICMPAFNSAKYIAHTIESVLAQSYSNIELIIVDDGSTDGTLACVYSYKDQRIKIFKQNHLGASGARNKAFAESRGTFIKFLDSDDLIGPFMIENQLNLALEYPGSIVSGKWGRFYNNDLTTFRLSTENCWKSTDPLEWITLSWNSGASMTQPGIFLMSKSLINKCGLWNEDLTLIDDLEFFTRAILNSERVVFDPKSILYYRSGIIGSLSNRKESIAIQSAYTAMHQATKLLLQISRGKSARRACANLWQSFVYNFYPSESTLIKKVEEKILLLGGADLCFQSGGLTKYLVKVLGWKLTVRFKKLAKLR